MLKPFYSLPVMMVLFFTITISLPAQAQNAAPATLAESLLNQGGAGDLLVAPTRVLLEGRKRADEIVLSNQGNKEATYRVSFTHLMMQEDGTYNEIDEETAKTSVGSADSLLRYSPRQVTLKPGESQVVKIMTRKREGLADGEYISHLLFRAIPDDMATGVDVEATTAATDQIDIKIIPIYGVSIPIILRHGNVNSTADINNARRSSNAISFDILRSGNGSVYGDISIIDEASNSIVHELKGIAVLAYLNKRTVTLPLNNSYGSLRIEYKARAEEGGGMIASTTVH